MRRSSTFPWTYVESLVAGYRARPLFADVQSYAMFIGQPRSGTSLIGSLLNAHRHVWIAQELNALRYVARGYGRNQLYWLLYQKDREFEQQGRSWTGYDYGVPGQWQGRCEQLRVIGDKKAGLSSEQLRKRPELLDRLRQLVQAPVRIIHVVRNPFNVISTIHRKRNRTSLPLAIRMYFDRCETNWQLMQRSDLSILTLRLEELIADPHCVLSQMCRFLQVEPEADFLQSCAGVLFAKPRESQLGVAWSATVVNQVKSRMQAFPFLDGYEHREASRPAA